MSTFPTGCRKRASLLHITLDTGAGGLQGNYGFIIDIIILGTATLCGIALGEVVLHGYANCDSWFTVLRLN